jgi:4-amino-4-deoxy-L-arabinose transferase-like glycosyltransferase
MSMAAPTEVERRGARTRLTAERLLVPALVVVGVSLRAAYYLINPSVSADEADLALNLMHRSYGDLFGRLYFDQAAPPGFLVLQKLSIGAFGSSTYALRLVPLLAGVAAVLSIYPVATRIAGRRAATLTLALVAFSTPLVTYAATNKQYSLDAAVTLGLYALLVAIRARLDRARAVLLAVVGAASVAFCFAAAFVLPAIWIALVVDRGRARRRDQLAMLAAVAAAWSCALAAAYLLTQTSIEQVRRSAGSAPTSGPLALQTFGGIVRELLSLPSASPVVRAGITLAGLVLAVVGVRALVRRSLAFVGVFLVAAAAGFLAAVVGLYPAFQRTFIFVAPSLLLLVATGGELLLTRGRPWALRAVTGLVLVTLLVAAAVETGRLLRPSVATARAAALTSLVEHARAGDSLYVPRTAQTTFRYYLECECFAGADVVAKARALWPIRPAVGYGQFDAALESSPRLIAGTSTGDVEGDYAGDFSTSIGRLWVLVLDQRSAAGRALTTLLSRRGPLLMTYQPGSGPAEALLYDVRR